jgi:hypothetical protein
MFLLIVEHKINSVEVFRKLDYQDLNMFTSDYSVLVELRSYYKSLQVWVNFFFIIRPTCQSNH